MFSLGIQSLLNDLATSLGPNRLVLAYLDDIYILSPDGSTLDMVDSFFSFRLCSIHLNQAKSKTISLQEIMEQGITMLGSCVGPNKARAALLEAKIDREEELLHKLVNLPHQHALLALRYCL